VFSASSRLCNEIVSYELYQKIDDTIEDFGTENMEIHPGFEEFDSS